MPRLLAASTLGFALVLASTITACPAPAPQEPGVGQPAPRYAGVTLDGTTFELAAHRGEVVLVNVWATWCPPCRDELPELARIHRDFEPERFTVVAISVDDEDAEPRVRSLARRLDLPFPIVLDPRSHATSRFLARAFPTSLLVDREGSVVWRRSGLIRPNDNELGPILRRTLNQRAPIDGPKTEPTTESATPDR